MCPVVVMTASRNIQDAVVAMREGAMDFLAKPVEPNHLLLMVPRAIAQRRMMTECIILPEDLAERRSTSASSGRTASCGRLFAAASLTRRRPMSRCCSRARAERGRNSSRARCT